MTTYTETTKTWTELNINQKRMVWLWFGRDNITNVANTLEFIIDDTDAVVGCTDELTSEWEADVIA